MKRRKHWPDKPFPSSSKHKGWVLGARYNPEQGVCVLGAYSAPNESTPIRKLKAKLISIWILFLHNFAAYNPFGYWTVESGTSQNYRHMLQHFSQSDDNWISIIIAQKTFIGSVRTCKLASRVRGSRASLNSSFVLLANTTCIKGEWQNWHSWNQRASNHILGNFWHRIMIRVSSWRCPHILISAFMFCTRICCHPTQYN